jgi:hypothetical protein
MASDLCRTHQQGARETLHRFDLYSDEKQAYWYNAMGRQESRDLANAIVRKMEKGRKLSSQICIRGAWRSKQRMVQHSGDTLEMQS